ncbi:peroxide stress protein YaaA, partial [Mycobacterium tuberculosis]|nr:peroxide stress protein YaaA [Mycobacterium tuberculosis]
EAEAAYVQDHLLITSALYGVIPALTPIAPHRLEDY